MGKYKYDMRFASEVENVAEWISGHMYKANRIIPDRDKYFNLAMALLDRLVTITQQYQQDQEYKDLETEADLFEYSKSLE